MVLRWIGADEVKAAISPRATRPFASRHRRGFEPPPQAPSPFCSSPGARFALLPVFGAEAAVALAPAYVRPVFVLNSRPRCPLRADGCAGRHRALRFLAAFPALAAVGARFLSPLGPGELVPRSRVWTAAQGTKGLSSNATIKERPERLAR